MLEELQVLVAVGIDSELHAMGKGLPATHIVKPSEQPSNLLKLHGRHLVIDSSANLGKDREEYPHIGDLC